MAEILSLPAPAGGLNFSESEYGLDPRFARICLNLQKKGGDISPRYPFYEVDSNNGLSVRFQQLVPVKTSGGTIVNLVYGVSAVSGASRYTEIVASNFSTLVRSQSADLRPIQYDFFSGLTISCSMDDSTPPLLLNETAGTATDASFSGGITANSVAGCRTFKSRVYYWEDNDDSFWYTAVGAYEGAVTEFDLSGVSATGGDIAFIDSISRDGGAGPDDFLAIFLFTGEVLVYQGSNPGDADDWAIVGRYTVPSPVSCRAFTKVGGDLVYLSSRGLVSLEAAMRTDSAVLGQGPMFQLNSQLELLLGARSETFYAARHYVYFSPNVGRLFVGVIDGTTGSNVYVFDTDETFWSEWGVHKSALTLRGDHRDEYNQYEDGAIRSSDFIIHDVGEADVAGKIRNVMLLYSMNDGNAPGSGPDYDSYVYYDYLNPSQDQANETSYDIQCSVRWGWQKSDFPVVITDFKIHMIAGQSTDSRDRELFLGMDYGVSFESQWSVTLTEPASNSWVHEWVSAGIQGSAVQPTLQWSMRYNTDPNDRPSGRDSTTLLGLDLMLNPSNSI